MSKKDQIVSSTLPYVFETAGKQGLGVPKLTIGQYTYIMNAILVLGCTILGIGIALEVRCGSVTMPGKGFPVAVSQVTGVEFPKVKICVDCSLVILAVIFCYVFFGAWQWYIVGIGTLFAIMRTSPFAMFIYESDNISRLSLRSL